MAFGLLFVLIYMMKSGGVGPSYRNNGASSSRQKGKKVGGGQSFVECYWIDKKDLSFDSFTVRNVIYDHAMVINDCEVVDGFLGSLEAQGWLSLLGCLESKVVMTLIAEFYHTMDRPSSLSCVQAWVGGRPFQVFAADILKKICVPNEGDVIYFENMTSDSLQKYVHVGELNGKVLKSKVI